MKIFLGILVFFLAFGWLVLLLAVTGLFYFATVLLSILLSLGLTVFFLPKISHNIGSKAGKTLYLVIAVSLLATIATCYFTTPTVFGGRDQGSIATAAIYLSQNHSLKITNPITHDLFQKYGPGKALNFPGFDYTKSGDLISRFPIGYTAYLASAYNLAGLKGIQYANFMPLFFFLVTFWLILKEFVGNKVSLLGFLLAATFFPFLWFAKYTLTETYMLFLVWSGIYFLLLSLRGAERQSNPELAAKSTGSPRSLCSLAMTDRGEVILSLAFFALSALTRIEGIIFFLLAAIYIYIRFMSSRAPACRRGRKSRDLFIQSNNEPLPTYADSSTRSDKSELSRNDRMKITLIIATLVLLGLYAYLNFPALIDSLKNLAKAFLPNSAKESAPSSNLYSYLARIFFNYNILAYLVLGLAGIGWLFLSSRAPACRRGRKSRDLMEKNINSDAKISRLAMLARNDRLIVFFITFPAFFYLLSPQITLDDPWLLRRFVFAVFPALLIYSVYALEKFFYHKIFLQIVLIVLIAANSVVSWRFFMLSENKDLLPQIEKISQRFGADDLILVDRLSTDSGFSLMSEPLRTLFGKNAVYFFNADDLKLINQNRYKNIYLVAPLMSEEKVWYADLIEGKSPTGAQIITNNFLEPSDKKWALAQNIESKDIVGIWKLK